MTQATTVADERTALYRFLNATQRLLYSGRSINPTARAGAHKGSKDWFHEVAEIKVTWYANLHDASIAEFVSIAVENPEHNVQRPHINGWIPGHGFSSCGRLWGERDGQVIRQMRGVGTCACGTSSPVLENDSARKRWHREHAHEVRLELLNRIATGIGLPQPVEAISSALVARTAEALLAA